jgi:hypothetical protein
MLTEAIAKSVRTRLSEFAQAGARTVLALGGDAPGWSAPAAVLEAPISSVKRGSRLLDECFGAVAVVAEYATTAELHAGLRALQPALVAAVWAPADGPDAEASDVIDILAAKVGRVVLNGWTTGAGHSWAQNHGGPWPATSNPAGTSIGAAALNRFVRPVAYQTVRDDWLPEGARRSNPWGCDAPGQRRARAVTARRFLTGPRPSLKRRAWADGLEHWRPLPSPRQPNRSGSSQALMTRPCLGKILRTRKSCMSGSGSEQRSLTTTTV